ncbi:protein fem-1 homolog C-like [Toxorhynchites rutilus septentrionalis]|uniref:protein fem-1 homolog C-like n=1 Tax=Toxorhynchites rutilus septentrionalis TaxID=329112 RepID=UPI0024796EA4|nr:protein fem-1 homolog C-like [Toxorhynchites rutilus septentrionalis]
MHNQHRFSIELISDDLIMESLTIADDSRFLSPHLTDRIETLPRSLRKLVADRQRDDVTPLFIACHQANLRIIKYLLTVCNATNDLTIYIRNPHRRMNHITPLGNACARGHLSVVKCLIELGCDVDGPFDDGVTPLQMACLMEELTVVQFLIENGADIRKSSYDGTTCLMKAATSVPIMSYLLEKGADALACDLYNKTALHYSIEQRNFEATCLLLRHGADPFLQNRNGDDALQTACIHCADEIVDHLVKQYQYSTARLADAYELIGSSYIDVNFNRDKASEYWLKSHLIRSGGDGYIQKKPQTPPRFAFGDAIEFTTSEELEDIAADEVALDMQSLLICDRVLGIDHEETLRRLLRRGFEYDYSLHFEKCIDLWILALKTQIDKYSILHTATNETAQAIVRLMMEILDRPDNYVTVDDLTLFEGAITVFKMLASKLVETRHLLEVQPVHLKQQENYDRTIHCITHLMRVLLCTSLCEDDDELIEDEVRKLIEQDIRSSINNDTLLHLAVRSSNVLTKGYMRERCPTYSVFPNLEVMEMLIECGADVNAYNDRKCTPLRVASQESDYDGEVVEALVDHGAHMDLTNVEGDRSIKYMISVCL